MSEELPLIAIVDDDESMREAVELLLRTVGYHVEAFASARDFLQSPNLPRTRCLIADITMPEMSGPELYQHLLASGRCIPTILMTGYTDAEDETGKRFLEAGLLCYLAKPFQDEDLLACVRMALQMSDPGRR